MLDYVKYIECHRVLKVLLYFGIFLELLEQENFLVKKVLHGCEPYIDF